MTNRDNTGNRQIELIRKFAPRCLAGYPTALLKLAEMAEGRQVRVPVVFSTGEMLYPAQRRRLKDVFQAQVAEYYGSNEAGCIAFECEHGNKHISEEHIWLETVDEAGQPIWDEPGRIVITDLDNLIMPLIRYELGDQGVLTREPCACGRSLLVLRELQGRRQDVLRNRRGDILPPCFLRNNPAIGAPFADANWSRKTRTRFCSVTRPRKRTPAPKPRTCAGSFSNTWEPGCACGRKVAAEFR